MGRKAASIGSSLSAEHAGRGAWFHCTSQLVQHVVCVWQRSTADAVYDPAECPDCWACCCLLVCLQRLKQETDGRLLVEALVPDFQVGVMAWWQADHSMCAGVCRHMGCSQGMHLYKGCLGSRQLCSNTGCM
jgi:hypothetical protein